MKRCELAALTATAMLTAAALPVQAEQSGAAVDRAQQLVEEVVVTARRREEGLQDAPLAVSAYTQESLDYRVTPR